MSDGSDMKRWRLIVRGSDWEFYRDARSWGNLLDDLNNLDFIEADGYDPAEIKLRGRANDGGPSPTHSPTVVALHRDWIAGACGPDWADMPQRLVAGS